MDATAAALRAAISIVAAALYAYVGRIVLRRHVTATEQRANTRFGVWWIALAFAFAASAIGQLLAQAGYRALAPMVALYVLEILLLVIAIWAVTSYLLYLFTGNEAWYARVTIFYALLAILFGTALAWLGPRSIDDTGVPATARQQLPPLASIALSSLLLLPLLASAIAYGGLFFRVREALVRYRVGLVASAFILQAAWSVVSSGLQLPHRYSGSVGFALLSTSVSVVAALLVLVAFRPPPSIPRSFDPVLRAQKHAALIGRVRDLV